MTDALWIILIGALVSGACGMVGSLLVLRREAMIGDAISHAVLPGIIAAFLLSGSRNLAIMIAAAGAFGVLTVVLTDIVKRFGHLQSDASMGVTFTGLFATGIILMSVYSDRVHIHPDHVLHGELLFAPFDTVSIFGYAIPRTAISMSIVFALDLVFILLCYKQLKVCAFDPALAASMGINVGVWHYVLMAFVSLTTVASFESVGAILVVAMLIVPANTAYMLTDRLSLMLVYSVIIGAVTSAAGYGLAWLIDGSIAGAMATVSGALFVLAAIFSPMHGLLIQRLRSRSFSSPHM